MIFKVKKKYANLCQKLIIEKHNTMWKNKKIFQDFNDGFDFLNETDFDFFMIYVDDGIMTCDTYETYKNNNDGEYIDCVKLLRKEKINKLI